MTDNVKMVNAIITYSSYDGISRNVNFDSKEETSYNLNDFDTSVVRQVSVISRDRETIYSGWSYNRTISPLSCAIYKVFLKYLVIDSAVISLNYYHCSY